MTTTKSGVRSTPRLSSALLERIDAIDGCQGQWLVDNRAIEGDYSFAFRAIGESIPGPDGRYRGPVEAAQYCASTRWAAKLLWQSKYLDDDCSWPGGYDAPSIYRSNARVFRDDFSKELEAGADGDGPGLSLDIRYVTNDMLDCLQSLEQYPLISEDDHSELELELQQEAWESWAASDWRCEVEKRLNELAPDDASAYWADEVLEGIEDCDGKLEALFRACAEHSNTYWQEESDNGQWIDLERVAAAIDAADLRDLTGLQLLTADQRWRLEPYPWPGADASPLLRAE